MTYDILFQVFDVVLNGDHTVVTDLDIFERVGRGVAHDEYVPFRVQGGKLIYNDEESDILAGKIRVEFIKVVEYFMYVSVYLIIFFMYYVQLY